MKKLSEYGLILTKLCNYRKTVSLVANQVKVAFYENLSRGRRHCLVKVNEMYFKSMQLICLEREMISFRKSFEWSISNYNLTLSTNLIACTIIEELAAK